MPTECDLIIVLTSIAWYGTLCPTKLTDWVHVPVSSAVCA